LLGRVTWTNDLGVLTSITGYRNVNEHFPNSTIGDSKNELLALGIVQDKQVTEEIDFASPDDQRLTWVAGLFYLHSNKREANPLFFNVDPNTLLGGFFSPDAFDEDTDQHIATDSYAIFGEVSYAFYSDWKLTLGARETWERKAGNSLVTLNPQDANGMFHGFAVYSRVWNAFTPKVTLSWTPEANLLLYATVSRGFKAGGYDLSGISSVSTADTNARLATPFQPETVMNYEVGEKYTGFDDRLVVDGDLFLDAYQKLQTNQLVLINHIPGFQTSNAPGTSIVEGVELEATGLPTDWLTLGLTYAYMDAHFDANTNIGPGPARIPYAPRNQVHLTGDVHFHCPELEGVLAFGADYTYHSKVFFNNANSAPQFVQDRSVWNDIIKAHAEYTSDDSLWRVSLWGKNLANDRPLLHAADVTIFFQNFDPGSPTFTDENSPPDFVFLAKYYPERTFGMTVTRNF
jgi:iron complex outermembrane receptor protein